VLGRRFKRGGGERPGALLARGTRALRRASFDARSQGQPRPLPFIDGWGNGEDAAWSSSCSRNAHDQNVLVRRAQLRINQAAL
jgi:hypothetical protein